MRGQERPSEAPGLVLAWEEARRRRPAGGQGEPGQEPYEANQGSHEVSALLCTLPATDVLFLPRCHCISLQYSSPASSHPPVPQLPQIHPVHPASYQPASYPASSREDSQGETEPPAPPPAPGEWEHHWPGKSCFQSFDIPLSDSHDSESELHPAQQYKPT